MPKTQNSFLQNMFQAVLISLVLAIAGAAVKTYLDVQELKLKFSYVFGDKWKAPASAK